MRDRILHYLATAGRPLPADKILKDVLNIRSPNAIAAHRVLKGILGNDQRFRSARGLWHLRSTTAETASSGWTEVVTLHLEQSAGAAGASRARGALCLGGSSVWEFTFGDSYPRSEMDSLRCGRSQAENRTLVAWRARDIQLWRRLLRACLIDDWHGESIFLRPLAGLVLSRSPESIHPEDLAPELGLPVPDSDRPQSMARFYYSALHGLLDRVPEEHRSDSIALGNWISAAAPKVDFSRFAFGPDFLRQLPESPGVYAMRNRAGDVLYVGKSGNLKRRVRSYFTPKALKDPKVARIHDQLHSLEVCATASEVEALLMEIRMIRDFRPPINLQLEVHEHPGTYGKEHNLVLLVPDAGGQAAQAYFLRDGGFVGQQLVPLGCAPSTRLRAKIRSLYFTASKRKKRSRDPWQMEIVSRWLAANRKRLNFVDVDNAGTYQSTMREISSYLSDPDRLTKKVYYR